MKTHFGYIDGSGEYFIIIDSDKCSGCGNCVKKCAQDVLELVTEFIDLEDKTVVAVKESQRKKISYTCSICKPENSQTPCILACNQDAITCVWKPQR